MQDRALTYFNALLHSYLKLSDHERPPTVRYALAQLSAHSMSICPERPAHQYLMALSHNRMDPRAAQDMANTLEGGSETDMVSRFLTNPDDLHVIQSCGLGLSHWRTFVDRLLGGYSRLRITSVASSLFGTEASGDGSASTPLSGDDDADSDA